MKKMIIRTVVTLGLLALLAVPASPTIAANAVSIGVTTAQVAEGSSFIARVNIDSVIDFDAAQYDITYNPAVIQVTGVTAGLIGSTTIPVSQWGDITPGTTRVINNVPNAPGVTGSGYLAEIHFHVVGAAGTSSTINLQNGLLGDKDAQEITTATWANGMVQVTASTSPPDGGGGGGGGGGVVGEKRITPLIAVTSHDFRVMEDIEAPSVDIKANLFIGKGTVVKNRADSVLSSIAVEKMVTPPDASQNTEIIGGAYDIGPNGARFEPPALLTLKYEVKLIPEGIPEENLYIATWNEVNHSWERMACTVAPGNDSISANLDHLSIYTIMAGTRPASFVVADLAVSPAEVSPGGSLKISARVTNNGDLGGSYEVKLKIDNEVVRTQTVTLKGDASQTVSFNVDSGSSGRHTVSVDNLYANYQVKESTVTQPPASTPAPTVAPGPARFTISGLAVTPGVVQPGEPVTISATVTNTGGYEGSYTAICKVNGAEEAQKDISVAAGQTGVITFSIKKSAEGNYTVNIGDLSGQFTVSVSGPVAPGSPGITGTVQPASTNWGLIGGIVAGVVIILGLLAYLLVWRRLAHKAQQKIGVPV
ncbi:MAG: cohesin domain-containing protein [Chloroflexota bacterium]